MAKMQGPDKNYRKNTKKRYEQWASNPNGGHGVNQAKQKLKNMGVPKYQNFSENSGGGK
ncbi:hypothetical protein FACS1894110_27050 [Spirochaetia bacterium]|nr:hypothetical protein FACS1894110_27050 [Spirochaetia bacterium]